MTTIECIRGKFGKILFVKSVRYVKKIKNPLSRWCSVYTWLLFADPSMFSYHRRDFDE